MREMGHDHLSLLEISRLSKECQCPVDKGGTKMNTKPAETNYSSLKNIPKISGMFWNAVKEIFCLLINKQKEDLKTKKGKENKNTVHPFWHRKKK